LHHVGYYTLNNLPEGEKLALASASHNHAAMTGAASASAAWSTAPAAKPAAKSAPAKTAAATAPAGAKRVTTRPASWPDEGDITINMGTKPGLKFDPAQIRVKPGARVKVVFNNDDDMLHNFVLVAPGTAVEVGTLAMQLGLDGQAQNYVPPTDKVLYHTLLLQPETAETIYFTAPATPGEYTFVCTVPGHFYVMQGKLRVVAN
jgi:uncharacterized cupredoxin-like copper-binding protein